MKAGSDGFKETVAGKVIPCRYNPGAILCRIPLSPRRLQGYAAASSPLASVTPNWSTMDWPGSERTGIQYFLE